MMSMRSEQSASISLALASAGKQFNLMPHTDRQTDRQTDLDLDLDLIYSELEQFNLTVRGGTFIRDAVQ